MTPAKLSPRYRAVLGILIAKAPGFATTAELSSPEHDQAVHSTICELRKKGIPISPATTAGKTERAKSKFKYRLVGPLPDWAALIMFGTVAQAPGPIPAPVGPGTGKPGPTFTALEDVKEGDEE